MLSRVFDFLKVRKVLRFGNNAKIEAVQTDGTTSTIDLAELAAIDSIGAADLAKIDGITNGTAAASKALVLDGSKGIATITSATITTLTSPTVNATNVDAGASGTAGTVDVFPATAAKGKFTLSCANQTGDTAVTLNANAMGQATQVNVPDPGAATSYVVQSTAAVTLAEADVLDGAVAGTVAANKAVIPTTDKHIDALVISDGGLALGAGAGTAITATAAELNLNDGSIAGTAVASKTLALGSTKNVDTLDVAQGGLKADAVVVAALKWVDVAVTAALLDAAGSANVIAGVAGDQYKIRDIKLVGGGTNFGAGGDRLIDLTDGTTVWTTIANADIETAPAVTLDWGNAKVPYLTGTSNTASASAAAIRFQYSGGSADHTTGSITFSVCIEKVA